MLTRAINNNIYIKLIASLSGKLIKSLQKKLCPLWKKPIQTEYKIPKTPLAMLYIMSKQINIWTAQYIYLSKFILPAYLMI